MNRSERRKLERKYGTEVSMQEYREQVYSQGIDKGIHNTIEMVLYMTAYTINYKLGFGKERLIKIMTDIILNIDSYRTGQLTHEDFVEIKKICNNLGFNVK